MDRGLLARVAMPVVVAGLLGMSGTGTASAATPPMANALFTEAGAPVFPSDAVGFVCQLGFCDGVQHDLDMTARPRYRSSRAGEAVLVTCVSGDLAGVVGFFDTGDDVVSGWANMSTLRLRDADKDDQLPACGKLT